MHAFIVRTLAERLVQDYRKALPLASALGCLWPLSAYCIVLGHHGTGPGDRVVSYQLIAYARLLYWARRV
eukprot:1814880-Rhodomonas_salina.3